MENNKILPSDTTLLDDYCVKDMEFVDDNIIILVKPREQYMFNTKEFNE